MPLLGSIIKSAIELKSALSPEVENAAQAQAGQLIELLNKARGTSFGIYYGFDKILESENPVDLFQQKVPIFDYDKLHESWWRQQQLEENITWPGKPQYFALSSGTTGRESKRIPVTPDMLRSFRSVGIYQVESLANFDLPPDFFEKDILMLSSSADLMRRKGHLEGEISGINTSNLPSWFSGFYKPGLEIASIDNWDERVAAIVEKAPEWDVCALAGIPSWIQMMLKKIIEAHALKNIHELWPNLALYASGGVAFAPYRSSLEKLLARPLIYVDTYLASEGFFAFTARPDTLAMKLALEHGIFYEFIPFNKKGFDGQGNLLEDPEVCTIAGVEEGQEYAMLITTAAGSWRYMIGDTIKFTSLERMEMVISGRTKYFLNVVGSQLSEEKINTGIAELCEKTGLTIKEFSVSAIRNDADDYIHQWVLGIEDGAGYSEQEAAEKLDQILQELNKNYQVARSKALKGVKAKLVDPQRLYDWLESTKKKGGQIKMPKVMPEDKMKDLLAFLQ